MALTPSNSGSQPPKPGSRDEAAQDGFLREVDEALREDEMRGLMQRYGKPIAAIVIVGLVALAGWLWWQESHKQAAGERGEQLTMALDRIEAGNLDAGATQLKPLAAQTGTGTAAAARLMQAGIALEQNRTADAVKLFAAVAADEDAPQPMRDLATVREIAASFDSLPPATVIARLKPLAKPGNAWFGPAGELLGLAYLKQGNTALAGPLFAAIARDKEAPETLRRRARQMAGTLGADAIDDPEKTITEEATPQP